MDEDHRSEVASQYRAIAFCPLKFLATADYENVIFVRSAISRFIGLGETDLYRKRAVFSYAERVSL
jgi:hypothetical protein